MQPMIIAHRGASAYAKENTLAAFEMAIALGASMIEFDIRRTKDRVLIAYHDADLNQRPIRKMTYAELQAVDPDIPTLDQVLTLCKGRIQLDVELKEVRYEPAVVERLLSGFPPDDFVITSFHPAALKNVKRHYPDIKTGFLFGNGTVKFCRSFRLNAKAVRDRVRHMHADFIAPHWQLLDSPLLTQVVGGDLPIFVWTVNDIPAMTRLLGDRRIEGIITDTPDVGIKIREAQLAAPLAFCGAESDG